jgi:hypothetical protein
VNILRYLCSLFIINKYILAYKNKTNGRRKSGSFRC